MSDPLLTTLCRICHVKPYNYRCPRCSTLTCSLPCIKRHKQWAQCNGVRDPAVYIKQKDLATPRGIDHDYNYLTSIEREIDLAEKNATGRGVVLVEDVRPRKQRYEKGELNLKKALEKSGAIVGRAPKGMSRSKQNKTHWDKGHRVLKWSVEWIHPDGSKASSLVPEDQPIHKAYGVHLDASNPIPPYKRRKSKPKRIRARTAKIEEEEYQEHPTYSDDLPVTSLEESPSFDRLLEHSEPIDDHEDSKLPTSDNALDGLSKKPLKRKRSSGPLSGSQVDADTQQQLQRWKQDLHKEQTPENTVVKHATEEEEQDLQTLKGTGHEEADLEAKPSELEAEIITDCPPPDAHLSCYLHHPSLPSPQPVLIPLASDATLSTTLPNRLVLEFPTIYVLNQRPGDKLPEKFISEEDFFARVEKDMEEEIEEGEVRVDGVEEVDDEGLNDENVDEKRLLEVLGKDLGGVTGVM